MKLKATLIVEIDDEAAQGHTLDDLRDILTAATKLDIDTDEAGGVIDSVAVDWNTLAPAGG